MHKNIPVIDLELLDGSGSVMRLFNLQTPEHLPPGVMSGGEICRKSMHKWLTGRAIPAGRDGII